jgi:glyoxylase-like metal-dependent hydrolase (beta-lactamase superfamily II)
MSDESAVAHEEPVGDAPEESPAADTARRRRIAYPFSEDVPGFGEAREVAPGVHWLRMPLPFKLDHINLWAIEDGDGWCIVDTGLLSREIKDFWRAHFDGLMGGRPVTRVIVTHLHPDHVGLAGWLTHKFSCPLLMTRTDYLTCRNLAYDTGREAPYEAVNFYRAAGWDEAAIETYKKRFGGFGKGISRLPESFTRIRDGERLTIGGREWIVREGRGHAPEHACLHCPALKLFISGDQVLPKISSNVSVTPREPDDNPLEDWIRSCRKLGEEVPDDVLVLPAHNEPFEGLHTRLRGLIAGHERALKRLARALEAGPVTASDQAVFSVLFKRTIGPEVLGMATGEAIAHLNCLIGRGLARKRRGEDGLVYYAAP